MSSALDLGHKTFRPVSSGLASKGMDIGARLKAKRDDLSLSHEQLAVKTGGQVGRQSVINIELHGQLPKADTLRALAVALNVSADYLLGLTDDPTPPPPSAAQVAEQAARVARQGP